MTTALQLLQIPATYASALGVFAAVLCYRANPTRATNRAVGAVFGIAAAWQLCVALAIATGNVSFWSGVSLPVGGIALAQFFLLHDACLYPHASLSERLRRTRLAWLVALAHIGAGLCKRSPELFPSVTASVFRLVAAAAMILAIHDLRKSRRAAQRAINAHEMTLFKLFAAYAAISVITFLAIPAPLSASINTGLSILFFLIVLGTFYTERVFDIGGTAILSTGYIIRLSVVVVLFVPLARATEQPLRLLGSEPWTLSLLAAIFSFPLATASTWLTQRFFPAFLISESAARRAAMQVLRGASSEAEVLSTIAVVAKRFLRGTEVIAQIEDATRESVTMPFADFVRDTRNTRNWFSPELALRLLRGAELDQCLNSFAQAKLGGLVRYVGQKVTVVLLIGQRSGGTRPITSAELEFLYELATAAGTSIDRLRAIEEGFRARHLAMTGRLAADFSHSARNQISAILALVEAVKNDETAQLSPEYREAVYQETLALVSSHGMAAEIARLDPEKLDLRPIELAAVVSSVAATYRHLTQKCGGQIEVAIAEPVTVQVDERLLRQVLLNLLRNALQACTAAGRRPALNVRMWRDDAAVIVDVTDNGPGVPVEVHDRLFTPWATSKPDGTGLGLAFCLEAMRTMNGTIRYLTARGSEHAWFQLELPCAATARIDSPPMIPAAIRASNAIPA